MRPAGMPRPLPSFRVRLPLPAGEGWGEGERLPSPRRFFDHYGRWNPAQAPPQCTPEPPHPNPLPKEREPDSLTFQRRGNRTGSPLRHSGARRNPVGVSAGRADLDPGPVSSTGQAVRRGDERACPGSRISPRQFGSSELPNTDTPKHPSRHSERPLCHSERSEESKASNHRLGPVVNRNPDHSHKPPSAPERPGSRSPQL